MSAKICETGISCSFHLKISVPSGLSTRKHSAKPARSSSRQSPSSFPYFFSEPSLFAVSDQMRRIEYHQGEGFIFPTAAEEVRLDVWIDHQRPTSPSARFVGEHMTFPALVHEDCPIVLPVEPEHARAAAGIQDRPNQAVQRTATIGDCCLFFWLV